MKRQLVAAIAVGLTGAVATTAPAADAASSHQVMQVLYDQTSGTLMPGPVSTGWTAPDQSRYSAAGADDFTVPSGTTWAIKHIDAIGQAGGPKPWFTSATVSFYADAAGSPGTLVATQTATVKRGKGPEFRQYQFDARQTLSAGTYWLAIQVNGLMRHDGGRGRTWFWLTTSETHAATATWENPQGGEGVGCTTWTTLPTCYADDGPSFAFDLRGAAR
jgi:hypothetical protein